MEPQRNRVTMCPSAQPGMEGAKVFAIIQGPPSQPMAAYLDRAVPLTPAVAAMTATVDPREVFRIAAACASSCCRHFASDRCQLVTRLVQVLPEAVSSLPACVLRSQCLWWKQEGIAACKRCPQIVTRMYGAGELLREAARPR